jgi:hypothetical protein
MLIGGELLALQQSDFEKCATFYRTLKLSDATFTGENLALAKTAHKISFTMVVMVQKLSSVPEWAKSYLQLMQTDSIQLIPSVIIGNRRSLHLYERACIEDFLRYIYYFDHRIEHVLLQSNPTRFETIDSLIAWIKEYPDLAEYEKSVMMSCDQLKSGYKELSKTVHGAAVEGVQPGNSLEQLNQPLPQPIKERELMALIFRNIFFLLSLFHVDRYREFTLDEKRLVAQHLDSQQKRILQGLM